MSIKVTPLRIHLLVAIGTTTVTLIGVARVRRASTSVCCKLQSPSFALFCSVCNGTDLLWDTLCFKHVVQVEQLLKRQSLELLSSQFFTFYLAKKYQRTNIFIESEWTRFYVHVHFRACVHECAQARTHACAFVHSLIHKLAHIHAHACICLNMRTRANIMCSCVCARDVSCSHVHTSRRFVVHYGRACQHTYMIEFVYD